MNRLAALALATVSASSALASTPIDETIESAGAVAIEISNAAGSVTVTGGDGDDVRVVGELSDDAESLDVRRDGNRIVVHVILPENRRGRLDGTTLEVSAPRDLAVEIATVSADVEVSGMTGDQELASVSGRIQAELYAAEIRARSVSGRIAVESGSDSAARADISSVSGSVDLASVSGEILIQSVSGSIDVESPLLVRGDIKSVSGRIDVRAALAADGRLRAVSTSGPISLDMLDSGEGRYEISTFSGTIENCFGPDPERPQFGPPTSTLRFEEGETDKRIDVNSMSGAVELCRRR